MRVFRANCKTSNALDIFVYLLINILNTCLLGASNYCMQCLSSPTRDDVDKAHSKNKWVDIGVRKVLMWGLLALSSRLRFLDTIQSSSKHLKPINIRSPLYHSTFWLVHRGVPLAIILVNICKIHGKILNPRQNARQKSKASFQVYWKEYN